MGAPNEKDPAGVVVPDAACDPPPAPPNANDPPDGASAGDAWAVAGAPKLNGALVAGVATTGADPNPPNGDGVGAMMGDGAAVAPNAKLLVATMGLGAAGAPKLNNGAGVDADAMGGVGTTGGVTAGVPKLNPPVNGIVGDAAGVDAELRFPKNELETGLTGIFGGLSTAGVEILAGAAPKLKRPDFVAAAAVVEGVGTMAAGRGVEADAKKSFGAAAGAEGVDGTMGVTLEKKEGLEGTGVGMGAMMGTTGAAGFMVKKVGIGGVGSSAGGCSASHRQYDWDIMTRGERTSTAATTGF